MTGATLVNRGTRVTWVTLLTGVTRSNGVTWVNWVTGVTRVTRMIWVIRVRGLTGVTGVIWGEFGDRCDQAYQGDWDNQGVQGELGDPVD